MKWLKRGMLAIGALIVLLLVVGMLLPSKFKVQRSQQIAAPPARIYPLIAEPRQWKNWAIWNQRDPTMLIQYSGPERGAGAKWSWQSKTEGNGSMEFTAAKQDQSIAYSLSFPDFDMASRGEVRLVPDGGGTRVIWTNEGDMGTNPVNRYFGVLMDSMVGPDFEAGLKNLKALAERG